MKFVEYFRSFVPPWLRRYWGALYTDALAEFLDSAKSELDATVSIINPDNTRDALSLHASMRNIPIHSSFTDAEKRAVINACWALWEFAGTDYGITSVLEALGFSGISINVSSYPSYTIEITDNIDRCVLPYEFSWDDGQVWDMGYWGGVEREWETVICAAVRRFEGPTCKCDKISLMTTWGQYDVSNVYRSEL